MGYLLVTVSFTYLSALLIAAFLGIAVTPYLTILFFLTFLVCLARRVHKKAPRLTAAFLAAFAAFFVYTVMMHFVVEPAERYAGNRYRVQMELLSEADRNYGNFYYKARVRYIEDTGENVDITVRLSHGEALHAEIGDTVTATVRFLAFQDSFGLSSKTARLANKQIIGAYISDYTDIIVDSAETRPLAYYLAAIRSAVRNALLENLPRDEAAVICAMLVGLRGDIPADLSNAYRAAGASHLLVISGMHMAIITEFMLHILMAFRIHRRHASLITILFILLFMVVSGLSASVVRSGVMQIIMLFGYVLGREVDRLNSLAAALLLMALLNPFCVGDISLLLSFSATLGIIQLSPRLLDFLSKGIKHKTQRQKIRRLLVPVTVSAGAVIGALPVQLYVFGEINFSSLVTSLLVLYISAWLLRLAILAVVLLLVPGITPAAMPFVFASGLLAKLQNAIIRFVAKYLHGSFALHGKYVQTVVIIAVMFLLASFFIMRQKLPAMCIAAAAVFVLVGSMANGFLWNGGTRLLVLDDTYAQCTALLHGNSANILYCSGDGEDILAALESNGVKKIAFLHVGSAEREVRCAEELSAALPVETALVSDEIYFPIQNTEILPYSYGLSGTAKSGAVFSVSDSGDLLLFSAYGKTIAFENGNGAIAGSQADILITSKADTVLSAAYTVLLTDENADAVPFEKSGTYFLTGETPNILLRLEPNDSVLAFLAES